jgi:hypothetical protein
VVFDRKVVLDRWLLFIGSGAVPLRGSGLVNSIVPFRGIFRFDPPAHPALPPVMREHTRPVNAMSPDLWNLLADLAKSAAGLNTLSRLVRVVAAKKVHGKAIAPRTGRKTILNSHAQPDFADE